MSKTLRGPSFAGLRPFSCFGLAWAGRNTASGPTAVFTPPKDAGSFSCPRLRWIRAVGMARSVHRRYSDLLQQCSLKRGRRT